MLSALPRAERGTGRSEPFFLSAILPFYVWAGVISISTGSVDEFYAEIDQQFKLFVRIWPFISLTMLVGYYGIPPSTRFRVLLTLFFAVACCAVTVPELLPWFAPPPATLVASTTGETHCFCTAKALSSPLPSLRESCAKGCASST